MIRVRKVRNFFIGKFDAVEIHASGDDGCKGLYFRALQCLLADEVGVPHMFDPPVMQLIVLSF